VAVAEQMLARAQTAQEARLGGDKLRAKTDNAALTAQLGQAQAGVAEEAVQPI
jgi:hypothetical protein